MKKHDDYERMPKDELIAELESSLAERTLLQAGQSEGAERDRLLHELHVHQIELEVQNRNLREAQGDLEASRARYVDLFDLAPIAYFTFDERGCVREVNMMGAAMLRRERSHIVGFPFVAMARLDASGAFFSLLQRCFETCRRAEGELRLAPRGGEQLWVHAAAEPVLGYAGRAVACRVAFVDVTRLKAAEDERAEGAREIARLRDVEARALAWMREVVEQMPEAVVLVGGVPAGGTPFNAAAKALFGVSNGHAVDALLPDGTPLRAEDLPHARASRGERIAGLELRIRRPDGALVPVVVSAAPVREGRPGSAVAVYRDVTVTKRLEQEREEWTGIVAHDLRQPAMVVSLSAQLLTRYGDGLGPREAKSVARIVAAAQTLSRMIDDLLDVTLIDTRRLKLKLAPVDVAGLVKEIVDRSRPMFGAHAVDVQAPPEAVTTADPERVAQVVTNFLSNAVKYSEPPASDIEVRVRRSEGAIDVEVENSGQGMSAEDTANVFQRFYRTRTAQAGTLGGMGLGLYICKGLIDAHGGSIGVQSIPGHKTIFWFRLPERPAQGGAPAGAPPPGPDPAEAAHR